ncbi:AN1-type zinc finger protein 5-like [Grus japonensis]|uniref:AN1-type zinc finger protein 5-like n=1 Tax=Grus japonensis TaxID=30415 RepID=A0ABC9W6T5_GRUJA
MVRQAVSLQPMEVHGGTDIHLQPMEDPTLEQVEAPEGGCDPMGSPYWSSLLAGPVAPWKEEPTLEQFVKNCSPWEGLILKKSMEDCLPWEGPNAGAGEECEESSP